MISFNYESDFILDQEEYFVTWIETIITSEDKVVGEIAYIFCNDDYLHAINMQYLNHDTLTDIISFDYSVGNELHGDVFISVERVVENAQDFDVTFEEELRRVLVHGILHYCGYKDKNEEDENLMRRKEEEKMKMFHVKQ
mgnify:CR=1 FL=1